MSGATEKRRYRRPWPPRSGCVAELRPCSWPARTRTAQSRRSRPTVAPHFERATGYTDLIARFRRARRTSAAAEVQQDLLAPRISPIAGAELAGSLLPAYNVGGDWFDHAENPEGAWLTVADAMGKGVRATAVSAIALAALRGARRSGDSLEECCQAVDDAVVEMAVAEPTFLTAVIATWHAASRTLAWVNCGHPPPLLIAADGTAE